jgi:hypothetical protein
MFLIILAGIPSITHVFRISVIFQASFQFVYTKCRYAEPYTVSFLPPMTDEPISLVDIMLVSLTNVLAVIDLLKEPNEALII